MKLFKSDPIAALKSSIAKTERAIAKGETHRASCEKVLEEARERWRATIREDPENIPAEVRAAIVTAEADLRTAEEELAEFQKSLAELQESLAIAEEKAAGEKNAATLEHVAGQVDAAAADLETAMKAVAKAAKALEAALPETLAVYDQQSYSRSRHRKEKGPATPREVVSALVAESLYAVVPAAFDQLWTLADDIQVILSRYFDLDKPNPIYSTTGEPGDGLAARAAARVLVSDRLRARAAAIRAGEAPSTIDDRTPWRPAVVEPEPESPPDVEIIATKHFSYVTNYLGYLETVGNRHRRTVPAAVAEAAIDRGLALRTDTPDGAALLEEILHYQKTSMSNGIYYPTADECEPLGDIMNLMETSTVAAE